MKKVGKIVLWVFVGIIAIGVIAAIVNPAPTPSNNVKADQQKETPTPKPQADPGEITLEEFNKIENGLTLAQVEEIIGGKGELQSSAGDGQYKTEIYTWKGAGGFGSNANVTLQGDKVMAKAQLGLQ
jgi:hypothetical protein